MEKFIRTGDFRDLEYKVNKDEISYSRMVEIINELAYKHYIVNKSDVINWVACKVELPPLNKEILVWNTIVNEIDIDKRTHNNTKYFGKEYSHWAKINPPSTKFT